MDKELQDTIKVMKALKKELELLNNTLPSLDTDRIRYVMKKLYTDAQMTRKEMDSVSLRSEELVRQVEKSMGRSSNYIEEVESSSRKLVAGNQDIYEASRIMHRDMRAEIEWKNIAIISLICLLIGFSLGSWLRIEKTKSVVVEWWGK